MEGSKNIPPMIRYIADLAKSWRLEGGIIIVEPFNAGFDKLVIMKKRDFIEIVWSFICILEIVQEKGMTDKAREIYRASKNLECELVWRGRIFREPFFDSSKNLSHLRSSIPAITIDPKLAKRLNSKRDLMKAVKAMGPDTLEVCLFPPLSWGESPVKMFYENPKCIRWVVEFNYGLQEVFSENKCREIVREIFGILSEISYVIKDMMKEPLYQQN